ncbi:MAG: site-specific integrase, partial [Candidatus Thiodiazotropha sp. (ex Lucinoma kastoroae)]|nr:site-specific integrase [Candidatus Thiodiazotropha sp. (ex Lucinoma kastoroae)]
MAIPNPVPLYPAYNDLKDLGFVEYPELGQFLESGEPWWMTNWCWGQQFLSYIGRNKSEHTFTRFRNETERFLLWLFLIKSKPMDQLRKADILEYADFCWQPPASWISLANHEKFVIENGCYTQNKSWAPYKLKVAKNKDAN